MKRDITDLSQRNPFDGLTVVALGHGARTFRHLYSHRRQLAGRADKIVLVLSRRMSLLARPLTRALHAVVGLHIEILTSPEPNRHGLSVNRILQASRSGRVAFLSDTDRTSTTQLRDLFSFNDVYGDDVVSVGCWASSGNIHTRLNSAAITINAGISAVVGELDESFDRFQDAVDDLHGRATKHSLEVKTIGVPNGQQPPPIHPKNLERYPWLGATLTPDRYKINAQFSKKQNTKKHQRRVAVLVDLRDANAQLNGTSRHAQSTVTALASIAEFSTTVAVSQHDATKFEADQTLNILTAPTDNELQELKFDVSFVVNQLDSVEQAERQHRLADYVIVSHLDFIAFGNPSYFADVQAWQYSQQQTVRALQMVDGVAWLSDHARVSANDLRLNLTDRQSVCGTVVAGRTISAVKNKPASRELYVATIGASYHHKSRMYALRVFREMVQQGWAGGLVLAGWDPPHGTSRIDEEELVRSLDLSERVTWLNEPSDYELTSLVENATALIQPSVLEGFGLVPFEAGVLNTPVFVARRSSLRDLLPETFQGWLTHDPTEDARRISHLSLSEENQIVRSLQESAADYSMTNYSRRLELLIQRVLGLTSLQ